LFGAPEFSVTITDGILTGIDVQRGAPCGATWKAAEKLIGYKTDDAIIRMGLEPQFFCSADPAGWDPIWGKSPVHFAGKVHSAALEKAIEKAKKESDNK